MSQPDRNVLTYLAAPGVDWFIDGAQLGRPRNDAVA